MIKPLIEWVDIPEGKFIMGADFVGQGEINETPHKVCLDSFKLSKYAITFNQYDLFCSVTGRKFPIDDEWGRENRPVINVKWVDAFAFAEWMGCRLPTEAEWEYACRAGTTTPFNTGKNLTTLQANYDGKFPYNSNYNVNGEFREMTLPVGSFAPNAWGLYEMHGNVWEWCNDWFGAYSTDAQTNPQGPANGSGHVIRGGSWEDDAQFCRSAKRINRNIIYGIPSIGFRLATSS